MSVSDKGTTVDHTVQLKRGFGLITACSLIIGNVVGKYFFTLNSVHAHLWIVVVVSL